MKILITNTGPWGTGSFTVANAITKELIQLGHEVVLFFPDTGIQDEDFAYFKKRPAIYRFWEFPTHIGGETFYSFPLIIPDPHPRSKDRLTYKELNEALFQEFSNRAKHLLDELIQEFQPDIIECQHIWLFDYLISKQKIPFIHTAHHSDQMGFRYDERMRPLATHSAKESSLIFAISEYVKDEVKRLYKAPDEKIKILQNGYDHTVFIPKQVDRKKICRQFDLNIPEDSKIISFAGKISKTKGIDTLLAANRLLKRKDIHFLILGSGSLDEVLDKKNLDLYSLRNVHILGHQPAHVLADMHNISDFNILPSRSEGFGIAALEAMGCALPIIGTTCGGLKEFAVGVLIPPENPQILVQAIEEMVSLSKEEYQSLQSKALHRAQSYSWKAIAEKRVQLYQEVI